jgi:hypothetical protein
MVILQSRRHPSCTFDTAAAHSGGGVVRQARVSVILMLLITAIPITVSGIDLVAVTASGRTVVLAEVEEDITTLEISCRDRGLTLRDPVVDIQGFAELENLRQLHFYHVPQIASYDFLTECTSLRRLVISFGRVRSLGFLSSLRQLKLLHLEFCSDWESDLGLPFVAVPIDLSANDALEYLAFRVCDLKRPPVIKNAPETLNFIDLSYNPMVVDGTDLQALELLKGVDRVVLAGASASASVLERYANLVVESSDRELSEYLSR